MFAEPTEYDSWSYYCYSNLHQRLTYWPIEFICSRNSWFAGNRKLRFIRAGSSVFVSACWLVYGRTKGWFYHWPRLDACSTMIHDVPPSGRNRNNNVQRLVTVGSLCQEQNKQSVLWAVWRSETCPLTRWICCTRLICSGGTCVHAALQSISTMGSNSNGFIYYSVEEMVILVQRFTSICKCRFSC
jgi:hypothetical protein